MKHTARNVFIFAIVVILFVMIFSGCDKIEATNDKSLFEAEQPLYTESCPYSVGDVTVIAIGHDKYALLESTDADGHQTWVLEGGEQCRSTSTFLTGNAQFITFTDEFYFYMQAINTSPDKIYLNVGRLEPIKNDNLRKVFRTITIDEFTTFPIIERVRYEGNEIWMELRYHVSETELSEKTVVYHVELPEPSSFEEIDTFET